MIQKTLRLRITSAAETIVRSGHPWLFADSIHESNRAGQLGELAVIYDRKDKFLAVGLFDPDSPIRVRILHAGKPQTIDSAWWSARLEKALAVRRNLFASPSENPATERARLGRSNAKLAGASQIHTILSSEVAAPEDGRAPLEMTNGYRLIHGESDGWPGLVLDKYDSTLVLKIYTGAWLPRLDEILALFQKEIPCERIVLRLSRNIQKAVFLPRPARNERGEGRGEGKLIKSASSPQPSPPFGEEREKTLSARDWSDGEILFGTAASGPVIFSENGIRFEADVVRGQKTGFFLDQRENRAEVEKLSLGKKVLNAFSFSGGFSVYAARGGAKSVTDLDISAHALESAKRNFALNRNFPGVVNCRPEIVQADCFDWLEKTPTQFDLIILDPPSLAKRAMEREGAVHAYERLNSLGIARLSRDGILVAGSCSAHVPAEDFFDAVRRVAAKSGRKFAELKTLRHPPDHPATFKEAEYLKVIYLKFTT